MVDDIYFIESNTHIIYNSYILNCFIAQIVLSTYINNNLLNNTRYIKLEYLIDDIDYS